jgi:hypothetical protein
MKYFILSAQQIYTLQQLCKDLGRVQESRFWTEEKEHLRISAIELYQESFKEIPDFIDTLVGYSSPNPNQVEIWYRNESGEIERSIEQHESVESE